MANMKAAVVKQPPEIPCPKCYSLCVRTETGWACPRHGLVRIVKPTRK